MDVTCDVCGLPTDDPSLTSDNRYLCPECNLLCRKCWGEGIVGALQCLNCSGTGLEPALDPDADIFG
jgi:hypothetical protein